MARTSFHSTHIKKDLPPYDENSEKAVLGAILLNSRSFDTVNTLLAVNDFYRRENQLIYKAFISLANNNTPIDILTLTESLSSSGDIENAGGHGYISTLSSTVPSSHNVTYYAEIVKNTSIRRQLIQTSRDIIDESFEGKYTSQLLLEHAEQKIFKIGDSISTCSYSRLGDNLMSVIDSLVSLASKKGEISGISSGFSELDKMTLGFHPSELTIIGARTGIGKTVFALNLAIHISVIKQIPSGFFSLEMSKNSIIQRIISNESRIDLRRMHAGGVISRKEHQNIYNCANRLDKAPLYIDDTPNIKLFELRAQARRMKLLNDVKVIFIDYIGLISLENQNIPKHEQMSEISKSLKGLARELNIPIVALSQVGRQVEGSKPSLADIRGSGSIEQDADVVIFLYRDRTKQVELQDDENDKEEGKPSFDPTKPLEVEVLIAKQRNGPVGDFKLGFFPNHMRFVSLGSGSSFN